MKIAISSNDGTPTSPFSARFGRCTHFAIYDTDTNAWQSLPNPAQSAHGGAGTQVVQFLAQQNIAIAISGHYGPNAFKALQATHIQPYQAQSGTPQELVEQVQHNQLPLVTAPQPKQHH